VKRRSQSKILKLIRRPEAIGSIRDNVAQRHVGIAVLRERRAAIIGIACIRRVGGSEGIGQLALSIIKVVILPRNLGGEVFGDFQAGAELGA